MKYFLFARNKIKFVSLKRIVPILSIILLTTITVPAQTVANRTAAIDPILRFFPNPATSFVNVDFQKSLEKGYTVQVYNFMGKKVYEAKIATQRLTIDLSDYTRGMYIYQLYDKAGKLVESGKFQVSK